MEFSFAGENGFGLLPGRKDAGMTTQEPPTRRITRLALGTGLIAMALAFAVADMFDNYVFGAQRSAVIGWLFVLAALGLLIIPVALDEFRKWQGVLIVVGVLCLGISFMAGMANNLNAQASRALALREENARLDDARRALASAEDDLRAAKRDRDAIAELGASTDLQRQHDAARDARDAEMNDERRGKTCGKACRDAEALMKALAPRITDAKAKEAARERVAEAEARASAARVSLPETRQSVQREAEVLAGFIGAPVAAVASVWDFMVALLTVLAKIIGPMMSGPGAWLIRTSREPVPEPEAKPQPKPKPARPSATSEAAARVVRGMTNTPAPPPKVGLAGFIEACRPGPLIPQKDVASALSRWWHATGQEGDIPAPRTLGLALVGAGFERTTQGRNKVPHYAIQLPQIAPTLAMTGSD